MERMVTLSMFSVTQVNIGILIVSLLLNRQLELWVVKIINTIVTNSVASGKAVDVGDRAPVYLSPTKAVKIFVYTIGALVAFLIGKSTYAQEEIIYKNAKIMKSTAVMNILNDRGGLFETFNPSSNLYIGAKRTIRNPCLKSKASGDKWFHWQWKEYDASVEVIQNLAYQLKVLFNGRYKCRGDTISIENMYSIKQASLPAFHSWVEVEENQNFTDTLEVFGKRTRLMYMYRKVGVKRDGTKSPALEIDNAGLNYRRTIVEQNGTSVLVYDVAENGFLEKFAAVKISGKTRKLNIYDVLIAIASDAPTDREQLVENLSQQVFPVSSDDETFSFHPGSSEIVPKNFVFEGKVESGSHVVAGLNSEYLFLVGLISVTLRYLIDYLKEANSALNEIRIDEASYIAALAVNQSSNLKNSNDPEDTAVIANTIEVDADNEDRVVNHICILHMKDGSKARPVQDFLEIK